MQTGAIYSSFIVMADKCLFCKLSVFEATAFIASAQLLPAPGKVSQNLVKQYWYTMS